MALINRLSFGFGRRLPLFLQTEATECGLACIAMIIAFFRFPVDLASLRRQYGISLKGATFVQLMAIISELGFSSRAVKVDLDNMRHLTVPCILHWNFSHFVVLKRVMKRSIIVHDPAMGVKTVPMAEVSRCYTGVALEVWPNGDLDEIQIASKFGRKTPTKVSQLIGIVRGLYRSLAQVFLLAVLLEIIGLLAPLYLQWVIDNVIPSSDRTLLAALACGFVVVTLLQVLIRSARSWVITYLSISMGIQWKSNVFSHLIALPTQYFEKRHLGDIFSRFSSIDAIQRTITTTALEALLDGIMTVVTLIMMWLYSPVLAAIAMATMIVYCLGRSLWHRPLRQANEEQLAHGAKQHSHFLETVRGVKAIKLFRHENNRRSAWLDLVVHQTNADIRAQKLQLLYRAVNGSLFGMSQIAVIWVGAGLVIDGVFTVGTLMAFTAYKAQFDGRVTAFIDKMFEFKMLQMHSERLGDIIFTPTENSAYKSGCRPEGELEDFSIEAKEVRFQYAIGEPFVFDGASFRVDDGECVALVGPSGAGKTTFVHMLLGILTPTTGRVFIGGIDLRVLGVDTVRNLVGTVLQEDLLFAGSIADNISFFDPALDQHWIASCAKMAGISDEIEAMPMRYNSLVGELGSVLSGGQKQRVLLARALYKRPKILVLDEASSHLDVDKERAVNATIKALKLTRIIIAHRPETIAMADKIFHVEHGVVSRVNSDNVT